jgi:hypothetical protein
MMHMRGVEARILNLSKCGLLGVLTALASGKEDSGTN